MFYHERISDLCAYNGNLNPFRVLQLSNVLFGRCKFLMISVDLGP